MSSQGDIPKDINLVAKRQAPVKADPSDLPTLKPISDATAGAKVLDEGGRKVVQLVSGTGSKVEVLPATSATVRKFEVGGENVLVYPEDEHVFTRGIPAPFVMFGGRIVGGKFRWQGQMKDITEFLDNQQMRHDGSGNALHGLQIPWELESQAVITDPTTGRQGAQCISTYDLSKNPIFKKVFDQGLSRASAKLTLTHTLIDDELTITYALRNDGEVDIANFTNLHPWIATDGKPVTVKAPTSTRIPYANNAPGKEEAVTDEFDFTSPKRIDGAYEEVFRVNANADGNTVSTMVLHDGTEIETTQNVRGCPFKKLWVNPGMGVASDQPLTDLIGSFTQDAEPTCDIIVPRQGREWTFKMKVRRPQKPPKAQD